MTDSLDALPWKSKHPAPAIGKDEKLLRGSRQHWMRYVLPTLVWLLLVSMFLGFLLSLPLLPRDGYLVRAGAFFAALAVLLAVQHWYFHLMLSENVTDILLTNKRVLLLTHRLLFVDTMDEIILNRIKMVEVDKRGILRHLFDYGDLWFDIGGGQDITYVPSPDSWARHVERMMNIS